MVGSAPSPQLPQSYSSSTRGRNPGDYMDRHFAGQIRLASGQELTLAIVADGFGERGLAASVSQLAIDTVLEYLRRAQLADIPEILENAFQVANKRMGEVIRRQDNLPLSTTLAAAVIYNNRLYVANVGNSRIYLARGGRMLLLTVDHTVAYEQITSGKLNTDEALRQPNAMQLSRSIGFDISAVKVDLGLYLQGGGESPDLARQQQGLELTSEDLVLVCSDGLIKPGHPQMPNKGPLASREEIRKILESNPAQAAVQSLGALVTQRQSADDVTAIVIEMPGRRIRRPVAAPAHLQRPPVTPAVRGAASPKASRSSRKLLWISLFGLFMITALVFLAIALTIGFSFLKSDRATATINPTESFSPTEQDLQSPLTETPGSITTQSPIPGEPISPSPTQTWYFTPTPTQTATPAIIQPPHETLPPPPTSEIITQPTDIILPPLPTLPSFP